MQLLTKLVSSPSKFSADDAYNSLNQLLDQNNPVHAAAFLTALKSHGLDSNPEIIQGCARAMRDHSVKITLPPEIHQEIVDVVGTGGDGHNTFNVSTTAAMVAAGAGCKVVKVLRQFNV